MTPLEDEFNDALTTLLDGYRNRLNKAFISKSLTAHAEIVERDETWTRDDDSPPLPTLVSLDPTGAVIGDADLLLIAAGTGFTLDSRIVFNGGIEPTDFVSDTELTTIVKPTLVSVAITVPVFVETGTLHTASLDFTFTDPVLEGE